MTTTATIAKLSGGLDNDAIIALMGKGRRKDAYRPKLEIFVDQSDEPVIDVQAAWPVEFGGKTASTLYQGFNTAINKAELKDVLKVQKDGEQVYLIHYGRVNALNLNGDDA